jgi:hypothetical protein
MDKTYLEQLYNYLQAHPELDFPPDMILDEETARELGITIIGLTRNSSE